MYQRILVPTDGSQLSDRAVKEAANLSRKLGATLTLFFAAPAYRLPAGMGEGASVQQFVPPDRYRRSMRATAKRLLDAAAEKAGGTATRQICEFSDQPYEAIIAAAQK